MSLVARDLGVWWCWRVGCGGGGGAGGLGVVVVVEVCFLFRRVE